MLAFKCRNGRMDGGLADCFAIALATNIFTFTSPIVRNIGRPNAMSGKRFGKLGIEIDRIVGLAISVSPTASIRRTLHPALDGMVIHHLYALKCRCSSYPPGQIDLYAGLLAFRESETKHSAMRQSGRFRLNLIIGKKNRVIACRGFFGRLVIPGTISFFRLVFRAGECMQIPDCRHHQKVPQIAVPADTGHLRKCESFDSRMLITIAGTVVASGNRVGADLHHTERSCRPGKRFSKSMTRARQFRIR